ncbi:carbohydrate-binding family 9-like protein [Mucilaginibacter sp.]|uniref:carbohydrate-binding family 9-like protein n=1 Tax=Mucilaginibacter sp. TaxID=1882438 RepID=UPI0026293FA8|nr:carbohydrate-binding family 9-like protein [Mucilaginibacter sp.]MDB5031970.1 hypothetical protein [Mucilaginibacter sp.]
MKTIRIPLINSVNPNIIIEDVSQLMDSLPSHQIDNDPWTKLKINCQTNFSIAHCGDAIFLKFYVNEDVIKTNMHKTNDPVCKDNCVEFFVSFGSENEYYNIEINCLGICLMGYGIDRTNRKLMPESVIDKIKKTILIKSADEFAATNFEWQITLAIPIDVFTYTNLNSFDKKQGRGNFFKCGDDLPEPHFLTWNAIQSQNPDFHLSEFFGELQFG